MWMTMTSESRNNVSRDMTASEDIEGFGARGCPLRGELLCPGSVRVWYDALFFCIFFRLPYQESVRCVIVSTDLSLFCFFFSSSFCVEHLTDLACFVILLGSYCLYLSVETQLRELRFVDLQSPWTGPRNALMTNKI